MVLELDGIAVHVGRYRPCGVYAVATWRSDALQHRRLGALVPRLTDGEDVEMLVGNDAAENRRLVAYRPRIHAALCQVVVNYLSLPWSRGRVTQALLVVMLMGRSP